VNCKKSNIYAVSRPGKRGKFQIVGKAKVIGKQRVYRSEKLSKRPFDDSGDPARRVEL
jgi:hypothetical protein